jgi:hypothetical protein
MTGIWHSMNPSSAGLQKPPAKVKTWSTPFSFNEWASNAPPRSLAFAINDTPDSLYFIYHL